MTPIEPYTVLRTAPSMHGVRVYEMLVEGSEVEDGGRWSINCEHADTDGQLADCGIAQDTNRARLWQWARHSDEWCPFCQAIRDEVPA